MTYLSNKDFLNIYSKVPRLNVDLIIKSEEGILLALRSIEPFINNWHLPGGTIYKGETIDEAARRVAQNETGLDIVVTRNVGFLEFTKEMRMNTEMHTVGVVVEAKIQGKEGESGSVDNNADNDMNDIVRKLKHDKNARDLRFHKILPENTIEQHANFLSEKGISL